MKILKTIPFMALAFNVNAAELVEFKTGDVATAEAFNNNFKVIDDKSKANEETVLALQTNISANTSSVSNNRADINANTLGVNLINTTIEEITNNSLSSLFIEDFEGQMIGQVITSDNQVEIAKTIVDAEKMVVRLQLNNGSIISSELSLSYTEFDCQGQGYSRLASAPFHTSRISDNGSVMGYDEVTNLLHYIPNEGVETIDLTIRSFSASFDPTGCINYDEHNVNIERVFIPVTKSLPDSFIWRCETDDVTPDCSKSLFLNFDAPYFLRR